MISKGRMLNQTRLRVYPRLFLITEWAIIIFFIILGNPIPGYDYLIFYSGGKIYSTDVSRLYDPQALADVSSNVFTRINNIYLNPPYFANFFQLFSSISYFPSLVIWVLLSFAALFGSFYLISKYLLPDDLVKNSLSFIDLSIISLSFFPLVFGIHSGQNHAFTLFFLVLVVIFCKQDRWVEAGLVSGFLIYKPQYVLIFLVIWIVWRKFRALAAFGIVFTASLLVVAVPHGLAPFRNYLNVLQYVWLYPFDEVGSMETSVYSLLAGFYNQHNLNLLIGISQSLGLILLVFVVSLAIKNKPSSWENKIPPIIIGLLFPFYFSPHVLFYDLTVLILFFSLWANLSRSKFLLWTALVVYISSLFLPLLARGLGISIMGIIPLGLTLILIYDLPISLVLLRK